MTIWKIFVGGGGDDWFSHIVETYHAEYAKMNPDFSCRCFSWTEGDAIRALLNGEAKGGNVTLVGHSYGGDTAFWVLKDTPNVDLLVSIDPVGRFQRSWTAIRADAGLWLNVRAEPSSDNRSFDDTIAWAGRKYPRPPAIGQPNAPNHSLIANRTHGDFRGMMRDTVGGVSGRTLLGGHHVG
ncbi:alpha/beta hydrolase [Sphingomonas sp. CFBP 8760]|uniref:alpha/beta hydrolase n=1 Tax=Sphingomonas sp. CFBP 8760 TaxID=2775282 RepID=UPI00177C3B6B|nr:alpha/beta hydrolase [Sphingomonas sp. CFBP 8760]MBD8545806.1 alpha/beta hydrolase [Sphingomonas sp. CFBP 8760]